MRVFVFTLGTRGDFELFHTLGKALRARGHAVTIATSPFYLDDVAASGLDGMPVGNGTQADLERILARFASIIDRTLRTLHYVNEWILPQFRHSAEAILSAAGRADYFINNLKITLKRGEEFLPGASVTYDPPGSLAELGMYGDPREGGAILKLVAMSKALVDPDDQWPADHRFTGFWIDPTTGARAPSPDLKAFLSAGTPPLSVTLGSMPAHDADQLVALLAKAGELGRFRVVVVPGWSRIAQAPHDPDRVFVTGEAPYARLFERSACVLHHGGCGTAAATVHAGKPSLVAPQVACQVHFASLLRAQGLAPEPIDDLSAIDARSLADRVVATIADRSLADRAEHWRGIVRAERGVQAAVELIEAHAQSRALMDSTA